MMSQLDASLFIENLPQAVVNFVEPLLAQLHKLSLDGEYSEIDHVCYRVCDLPTYELLKEGCAVVGTLLSEAYVNGRPIACYRLHRPVALSSGRFVDVLELPAPKPSVSYVQGFEHIEVVTTGGLESFRAKFSHLSLDLHNFGAGINRDVSLKLSGGLVKFHEKPLAAIISEEQKAAAASKRRRVAIFDFDDTVMASKEPFLQAFHKAYEAALGVTIEDVDLRGKQRPTLPEFFTALGVLDPAVRQRVQDLFGREWDLVARTCELPVGVPSLLSCLASEGVELHVWTARDAGTTDSTLKMFGLRHYFKSIHGFEQHQPTKPNGSPELREIVKGAAAVVVGDSIADQNAAKNLGVTFLQAAWITKNNLEVPGENVCLTPLAALSKIMALPAKPLI
jgi:uncharacterized protein